MADLRETKSALDPMKTYLEAVLDFYTTLEPLTADQWSLPTPCPGWSVADLVAHTIDLDSMAVGEPAPDHEPQLGPTPPREGSIKSIHRARRGLQAWEPAGCIASNRCSLPPTIFLTFFRRSHPLIKHAVGQRARWQKNSSSAMRAFDIWAHDQDVRIAIGAPRKIS